MNKFMLFLYVMIIYLGLSEISKAQIEVEPAFPNLSFNRPVDFTYANDNSGRLFVVEQQGRIYVFLNSTSVQDKQLFLDIRDRVNDSGNEQGLLGLTFHPDYQTNGYFFVDYTTSNPTRTVISPTFV